MADFSTTLYSCGLTQLLNRLHKDKVLNSSDILVLQGITIQFPLTQTQSFTYKAFWTSSLHYLKLNGETLLETTHPLAKKKKSGREQKGIISNICWKLTRDWAMPVYTPHSNPASYVLLLSLFFRWENQLWEKWNNLSRAVLTLLPKCSDISEWTVPSADCDVGVYPWA